MFSNITFLFYLIGPMLYWYIRSVLTYNDRLKRKDLWHLFPALVYLIAIIPYMVSPYSYKVKIATSILNEPGFLGNFKATFLSEIFSVSSVYIFRPLLVLAYTIWCIGLFIRFLIKNDPSSFFSRQQFMSKWLSVFLGFKVILKFLNS